MMLPEEWLGGSHSIYSQDMSLALSVWNAAAMQQLVLNYFTQTMFFAVHMTAYSVCSLANRSLFNLIFVARYVEENDTSKLTAHFCSLNMLSCANARATLKSDIFKDT